MRLAEFRQADVPKELEERKSTFDVQILVLVTGNIEIEIDERLQQSDRLLHVARANKKRREVVQYAQSKVGVRFVLSIG